LLRKSPILKQLKKKKRMLSEPTQRGPVNPNQEEDEALLQKGPSLQKTAKKTEKQRELPHRPRLWGKSRARPNGGGARKGVFLPLLVGEKEPKKEDVQSIPFHPGTRKEKENKPPKQ